jgi:thiol-disulfide isomerase/thioredoxin
MKIIKSKEFYKNAAFFAFLGILFFTPIGKEIRVYVAKLRVVFLNPSIEEVESQQTLSKHDLKWALVDSKGKAVELASLNDKPLIVNYWATWCPPCIAEMPAFQSLYNDYKDKVNFVFLTTDEKKLVDEFISKKEYTLPVYYQVSQAPPKLRTSSLPTTYLIDQNGKILIDEVGASDWNGKRMRDLLDKLIRE